MNDKTVLYVDDDEYLLKMVNYLFMSKGVKLEQANSGAEGLEKLRSTKIDLIISDISMPEMDGIEFCKKVKNEKMLNKIPVVVLSALPAGNYRQQMLAMGVEDYFDKPFDPKDLVRRVLDLLGIEKNGLAAVMAE